MYKRQPDVVSDDVAPAVTPSGKTIISKDQIAESASSGIANTEDLETPDSQWKSVLEATLTVAEEEGWDDEVGQLDDNDEPAATSSTVADNDDPAALLLDELSREEDAAGSDEDTLLESQDAIFAHHLKEQHRIAEAEEAEIERASSSHA